MQLIDTHTHLFGPEFDTDLNAVYNRAIKVGLQYMLIPNVDISTIPLVKETIASYSQTKAMWGLHPCHVFANWREELSLLEKEISALMPVAIGEIGLDFYWSKEFVEEQKMALLHQCEWAIDLQLPVSLHTRNATSVCIQILKPLAKRGLKGVFHCFSGSEEEAREIIKLGFSLGLGGTLTFKNNSMRQWIHKIPDDFLVLETDAPYLAPVPYRGKRNEPAFIIEVAATLAQLKNTSMEQIGNITTQNAKRIFSGILNAPMMA